MGIWEPCCQRDLEILVEYFPVPLSGGLDTADTEKSTRGTSPRCPGWADGFLKGEPEGIGRPASSCDVVISSENYIFGLCPRPWHRAPNTFGIS